MQHFFITPEQVQDGYVQIVGEDVNHMLNVLRMKPGEAFMVNDGCGKEY
jgi:16S rRNA (uracil1498-N3)-methyltransferase